MKGRSIADRLHESVMDCERRKDELIFALGACEPNSELEVVLSELLFECINEGLSCLQGLEIISGSN